MDESKFEFSGFPENGEFEIEDKPKKQPRSNSRANDAMAIMKDISGMTPDELKSHLPQEGIDALDGIAKTFGIDLTEMLNNTISAAMSLTDPSNFPPQMGQMLMSMMTGEDNECDDECCGCEEDCGDDNSVSKYDLGDFEYLKSDYFGSIECEESDNLFDEFTSKYGTDSTQYLNPNVGIKESFLTEVTATLPFGNVKDMKFIEATKKFLLYYVEPDIEGAYGFFAAIIKSNGEFAMYVPEFMNTFKIKDGQGCLFNATEDAHFFQPDGSGNAVFTEMNLPAIEFSINYVLAPKRRVILSPIQFGTIKNIIPNTQNDSMFLEVGRITSNESADAILLKKDAELDLDQTTFKFYFNFGRVVSAGSLNQIAQRLFKTNLNECPLMKYSELKFTNDGKLYVDVDLGEF